MNTGNNEFAACYNELLLVFTNCIGFNELASRYYELLSHYNSWLLVIKIWFLVLTSSLLITTRWFPVITSLAARFNKLIVRYFEELFSFYSFSFGNVLIGFCQFQHFQRHYKIYYASHVTEFYRIKSNVA